MIVSLESILFPSTRSKYRTRSHRTPPAPGQGQKPSSTSIIVAKEDSPLSESDIKSTLGKADPKPRKDGPNAAQVSPKSSSTESPKVTFLLVPDVQEQADSEETEIDEPVPVKPSELPAPDTDPKRTSKVRKYSCRMCKAWVDSTQELKQHHPQTHGIMCYPECHKAFNNQLSLARHKYEHKARPYECSICGKNFPFESQLKTHRITHINRRKHACTHPDCSKHFKNKDDMNRHIKEHTSSWLTCPDCPDYRTKEKWNFESHWLSHSRIEKYWCKKLSTTHKN